MIYISLCQTLLTVRSVHCIKMLSKRGTRHAHKFHINGDTWDTVEQEIFAT